MVTIFLVLSLGGNDQTCDGGRGQRGENSRHESRECKSGNVATSSGRELGKNTNLNTQRPYVAKSAQSIRRNELRAGAQFKISFIVDEFEESLKFVLGYKKVSIENHHQQKSKGIVDPRTVITFSAISSLTRRISHLLRGTPRRKLTGNKT